MRKYQQVALLILACFSLFGLLIYRKEYIELRSIFEGFHIFGDDIIIKTNCNDSVLVINNNENRLYNDGTKWVYIDHGIYIYSAYLINNKLIKAIGIGRKDSVMLTMKCHVWYDFRDTVFSYEGKFRYNILSNVNSSDNQENFIIIEYSCELDDNTKRQGVPHILVFIVNNNKNFVRIAKDNYKDAVMCVYPDYNNLNKLSIVEFISYHQILGYTDFIIYDELNFVILERLQSIIYKLNLSNSFHIFPSNIPYGSSMQTANILFELDCIYRTLNKSYVDRNMSTGNR
ncbi:hypothetical protein O3M35_004675 [Rhynocoris fuscipes]|uniref:Glycosyltransferase family 92 protein n=1 Tax=Rhynocoris fuscipes TaxID=488301 RepID=A0AAW1CLH4_9HEMI